MILTLITFFIVLSVLVFVHELGHFLVARRFGVKAEEFGFGFPPRIAGVYRNKEGKWSFVKGSADVADAKDTIYSLNWVPIGGFVKIKGEDGDQAEELDSFASRKLWQRTAILLAGVTMNFILAFVLISIGYMVGLPQVIDNLPGNARISGEQIQVVEVLAGSPAEKAALKVGDVVESINGKTINSGDAMQQLVAANEGKVLDYKIKRGADEFNKNITPIKIESTNKAGIGIGIVDTGIVSYPFFISIWEGLKATVNLTGSIIAAFYELIKGIFMGHGVGADLSGPVGIAVLTGQVARMGFIYVLQFTAMLSINLAIINAFPFPALDGGRVLFLFLELLKGKPIKKEIEGMVHYIGFALLMILVVAVTFRDIMRYADKFKIIWTKLIG